MQALIELKNATVRRVRIGHGDLVRPAYWITAFSLLVATLLGVSLGRSAATAAATILFIAGGLPHGAYDIALLRRTIAPDRSGLALATVGYVTIAILMASLWIGAPLIALILFLLVAAVHFGEDWQMLDEPLLRFAAGAAVIAAPTLGHRIEVAALFAQMSDPRAAVIAQIVTAAAPVTLLVTAVGITIAWRDGSRQWAAAMALCLGLLIVLPPVVGFALFFVFLHSPRHIAQTRVALRDMSRARWLATGAALSGAAVLGWCALRFVAWSPLTGNVTAQAFQLLASVAVPHLILSRWLERRLDGSTLSPAGIA